MNRRLLISVCLTLSAFSTYPTPLHATDPTPVCESGTCLYLRFDNAELIIPPEQFSDFDVSFDSNHVPSVTLLKGRTGQNNTGTLYQWRVWCKDASGAPANIGEIKGIANYDYDVKILSDTDGPGANSVSDIRLDPPDNRLVWLSGGEIGTVTGKLRLKPRHGGGAFFGGITGDVHIGSIVADQGPADELDYQVDIYGGVAAGGSLVIDSIGAGVHTFIGPVGGADGVSPAAQVTIGSVGRGESFPDPSNPDGSILSWLFIGEYNENGGDIYLGELLTGADVRVAPCEPGTGGPNPCDYCTDFGSTLRLTVGRMDGAEGEVAGAQLIHRGLYGTSQPETLSVGEMESGAYVYCDAVAGLLKFTGAIREGALVELGSVGFNVCTGIHGIGAVDLMGQPIEGTLRVKTPSGKDESVFGEIINGVVAGTGWVDVYGDIEPGGSIVLADVSGVVTLQRNVGSGARVAAQNVSGSVTVAGGLSGELSCGALSGTIGVGGNGYPGGGNVSGTVTTDDVTSSGQVNILGSLSGGLTVGGGVFGAVQVGGDQTGVIDVQGKLDAGASVSVAGQLKEAAQITINGEDKGRISVSKGTAGGTKIQARSGLSAGSLISVNETGGEPETVNGTIWIGGSTTQNPMPVLTMDGTVQINCNDGTFDTQGKVRLVGCAPFDGKEVDICIHGTDKGQIIQTLSCIDLFNVHCTPMIPCP